MSEALEKALEKLKIPSKFELLATAVLCKINRDYQAIMHTGLNAEGETRRSPVDGFLRVPNSNPPHYILVEHTIAKDLKKKWLFDHRTVTPSKRGRKTKLSESDDGDLLKAGQLSSTYKAEFPDAIFTVVLTTNQRLQPKFCLEVEKKAQELGVLVEFLERSGIARYLNTKPDGQWLRKEYLGIEAEMLSEDLLHYLCEKSLNEYQRQRNFLTSPDHWVSRHINQQVEKAVENQNCSISLLIGNSGSGKSAAAYQVGKKHLEEGGYSLWLSEDVLGSSDFRENALDKALHDLYPSLMPDAGNAALQLLKDGKRLLLIADDVNRTNSPANLLQKLINWSKPFPIKDSNAKHTPSKQMLICPVWSDIVRKITPNVDKTAWISSVFVGTMSAKEGLESVKDALLRNHIELPSVEVTTLAENLGNDPILIGLFDNLLPNIEHGKLSQVAENAIDSFISDVIEKVVGDLLPIEYRSALLGLTTQMLLQRRFNPKWSDIQNWISNSSEELQALRVLAKNEKLCRLDGEKLVFRHDRIREFLLVQSMGRLLNKNASEPLNIFWEPYYAEIIGQAIIQYPQSEEFLQELCDRLALALVESIHYFSTSPDDYQQEIITILKNWIEREVINDLVPKSVIDAICWSLVRIDSPIVLEITERFPRNNQILLARLRNGCAVSGINYCIKTNHSWGFLPSCNYSLLDKILEQANHYHKNILLKVLKELLISKIITDQEREGVFTLIGLFCFSELENEISICWNYAFDKEYLLLYAVWAAIRCCTAQSNSFEGSISQYWAMYLSEKSTDELNDLNEQLGLALSKGISDATIKYLISLSDTHRSLHSYLEFIFVYIDHPDTIEFIVRQINGQETIDETKSFNYWIGIEFIGQFEHYAFRKNSKLSKASRIRLYDLWKDSSNSSLLRYKAFKFWIIGIEMNELHLLKEVLPDSFLYVGALLYRIKLADYSIAPDLVKLLSENLPERELWYNTLLEVAHHVWSNEIKEIVRKHLMIESSDTSKIFYDHTVAKLLKFIPIIEAEQLLVESWEHIKYNSLYVQTALYIGTPVCMELAKQAINQCSDKQSILKSVHRIFGFLTSGEIERITKAHLKRLLPYSSYLDEVSIWLLADFCKKLGILNESRNYLVDCLDSSNRKIYYPTTNELSEELDKYVVEKDAKWKVISWVDRFSERGVSNDHAVEIIDKWLESNPTLKGLQIVSTCLISIGLRKNLALLDKYAITGSDPEIETIRSNTKFAVYQKSLDFTSNCQE